MHDSLALVPVETPAQDQTIVREWLRSMHCLTKIFLGWFLFVLLSQAIVGTGTRSEGF
jgi:hypothetical protein